jgi:hypothetical protein
MALSGTRAWRQGYTHIANKNQATTSTSSAEVACYACQGKGKKETQSYY